MKNVFPAPLVSTIPDSESPPSVGLGVAWPATPLPASIDFANRRVLPSLLSDSVNPPMPPSDQIRKIFTDTGALMEGHFLLSSGLHSPQYLQCAKVLQWPKYAEWCATRLTALMGSEKPDLVVSPAMGAILIGHELGRRLGCRAVFAERVGDVLRLRRGFRIGEAERALIADDVVTTGGSTRETMALVEDHGATPVAVASIIDRSGGKALAGVIHHCLWSLNIPTFLPADCPLCKSGSKPHKPGSRA